MIDAIIISVGTELTEGKVQDSHTRFITSHLKRLNIKVKVCLLVPDDAESLTLELNRFVGKVDILIVTGGLGPTMDDITSSVISAALGVKLIFRNEVWETIERRYSVRTIPESNRKQALIPDGFEIIENRLGTAPGFWGRVKKTLILCLPGPPRELQPMFNDEVLPLLLSSFHHSPVEELSCSIFTVSESKLEQVLQELGGGAITWGTRIDEDRIALTIKGDTEESRRELFNAVKSRLGAYWVREGNSQPTALLHKALRDRRMTLAVAESCTGGLLSKAITDLPGSSDIFLGACITYSNKSKADLLRIETELIEKAGVVSREVVEEMAGRVAELFGADLGIGISGIAGPSGGTVEKPVGSVWIAVKNSGGEGVSECFHFSGARASVRRKAAITAAVMAEQYILTKRK